MATTLQMDPRSQDESPVQLTPDQKTHALKSLTEAMQTLHFLKGYLQEEKLTVGMRLCLCNLSESHVVEMATTLGYESDLAVQRERMHAEVRTANGEIRRLEKLVGSSRGFDGVPELMSRMSERMSGLWKGMGFSLVYDSPHGSSRGEGGGFSAGYGHLRYHATLSCSLDPFSRAFSKTPVTDAEEEEIFHQRIAEQYDVVQIERSRDYPALLDTERNKLELERRLKAALPSLEVHGWNLRQIQDHRVLWSMEVVVRNCAELLKDENDGI
jgi:hypothetical protein